MEKPPKKLHQYISLLKLPKFDPGNIKCSTVAIQWLFVCLPLNISWVKSEILHVAKSSLIYCPDSQ